MARPHAILNSYARIGITVLIIGSLLFQACTPAKQSAEFRQMKKKADTLMVISPFVEINAHDFRVETPDPGAAERAKEVITRTTDEILAGRYALKPLDLPVADREKVMALFDQAKENSAGTGLSGKQTLWPPLGSAEEGRLALFITLRGRYNSVTSALVDGPGGTVYTPAARPRSELLVIVFDTRTNEIIYHDLYRSKGLSPRDPDDVETMARKVLMALYYK